MFTIIVFLLILSLLVVVHELGHFIAARKFGMRVYEFGIGFPPRALGVYRDPVTKKLIWVKKKDRALLQTAGGQADEKEQYPATVYSLNWLPLGGFCKIKGENGEEAREIDSFGYQKAWKRVIVLVAGVVMNFLLAAILLSIGFTIGIPTDVSEGVPPGAVISGEPSVVVQSVLGGSPAEEAGLRFGDTILLANNERVQGAEGLTQYIRSHGAQEISLQVKRGEQVLEMKAIPRSVSSQDEAPRLGIVLADAAIIRYPWYRAILQGFLAAWQGVVIIVLSLFILVKNLILGQGLAFEVSGPVGIATIVGQSARLGIQYLIHVTAMISLSLAVMNILPIPALDGGRVLFVAIEKIIRRPVPIKYEQLAHTIGFILLMCLILLVTWRDIVGLVR